MENKICIICGKEFMPNNKRGRNKIYCSGECAKINQRKISRENMRCKAEQRRKLSEQKKQKEINIVECEKRARELGYSYGYYKELLRQNGGVEPPPNPYRESEGKVETLSVLHKRHPIRQNAQM